MYSLADYEWKDIAYSLRKKNLGLVIAAAKLKSIRLSESKRSLATRRRLIYYECASQDILSGENRGSYGGTQEDIQKPNNPSHEYDKKFGEDPSIALRTAGFRSIRIQVAPSDFQSICRGARPRVFRPACVELQR